jgi:hypothetical protein
VSGAFQELTREKQVLIVTVLFGCCRDEEHNVRQAAVRGLAMCIQFPSLREVSRRSGIEFGIGW